MSAHSPFASLHPPPTPLTLTGSCSGCLSPTLSLCPLLHCILAPGGLSLLPPSGSVLWLACFSQTLLLCASVTRSLYAMSRHLVGSESPPSPLPLHPTLCLEHGQASDSALNPSFCHLPPQFACQAALELLKCGQLLAGGLELRGCSVFTGTKTHTATFSTIMVDPP